MYTYVHAHTSYICMYIKYVCIDLHTQICTVSSFVALELSYMHLACRYIKNEHMKHECDSVLCTISAVCRIPYIECNK